MSGYRFKLPRGLKMKLAGAVHTDSAPPGARPFLSITLMWHDDPLRWGAHVPILQGPEEKLQDQKQEPSSMLALDMRAHSLGKGSASRGGLSERTNTGRPQRTKREGWEGGPPDLSRISRFHCGSKLTRLPTEVTAQAQPQEQVWPRGRNPRVAAPPAGGRWECLRTEVALWKTARRERSFSSCSPDKKLRSEQRCQAIGEGSKENQCGPRNQPSLV